MEHPKLHPLCMVVKMIFPNSKLGSIQGLSIGLGEVMAKSEKTQGADVDGLHAYCGYLSVVLSEYPQGWPCHASLREVPRDSNRQND